jgi:hypothetical protein
MAGISGDKVLEMLVDASVSLFKSNGSMQLKSFTTGLLAQAGRSDRKMLAAPTMEGMRRDKAASSRSLPR